MQDMEGRMRRTGGLGEGIKFERCEPLRVKSRSTVLMHRATSSVRDA